MKKNLKASLHSELAGSGEGVLLDKIPLLLERQEKGEKLTRQEEAILAASDQCLVDLLRAPKDGYQPDKPAKSSEPPPLPFSSFAEGLAQLQRRIQKRKTLPQLIPSDESGAYRPDKGAMREAAKNISPAKIAAIVKMAQDERAKLKKR